MSWRRVLDPLDYRLDWANTVSWEKGEMEDTKVVCSTDANETGYCEGRREILVK